MLQQVPVRQKCQILDQEVLDLHVLNVARGHFYQSDVCQRHDHLSTWTQR